MQYIYIYITDFFVTLIKLPQTANFIKVELNTCIVKYKNNRWTQ